MSGVQDTALTVAAVLALMVLPRHPRVRALLNRWTERRILSRGWHLSARIPKKFRTGYLPAHDRCGIRKDEQDAFAAMVLSMRAEPDARSYRWITASLKAGQKGRRP